MPKHEKVQIKDVRAALEAAFAEMRAGRPSDAVRSLSAGFLRLLEIHPELLERRVSIRRGRGQMLAALRWPALGANLSYESLRAGKPEIEFARGRFALSEALTYYEFLADFALEAERPTRGDAGRGPSEP